MLDKRTLKIKDAEADFSIRHKLIRPYTSRRNGKVERSHREDQKQDNLLFFLRL